MLATLHCTAAAEADTDVGAHPDCEFVGRAFVFKRMSALHAIVRNLDPCLSLAGWPCMQSFKTWIQVCPWQVGLACICLKPGSRFVSNRLALHAIVQNLDPGLSLAGRQARTSSQRFGIRLCEW